MQERCKKCKRLWEGGKGAKGCLAQSQVSARIDPIRHKQAVDFWMGKGGEGDMCPFFLENTPAMPHSAKLVLPESARLITNVHKKEDS